LESLVQATLQQLILLKNFPRCLVQVVLQFQAVPENDYTNTKLVQANTVRHSPRDKERRHPSRPC